MKFSEWFDNKVVIGRYPLPDEIKKSDYQYIINVSDEYISYCHNAAIESGKKYFWFPLNECGSDMGLNSIYGALQIVPNFIVFYSMKKVYKEKSLMGELLRPVSDRLKRFGILFTYCYLILAISKNFCFPNYRNFINLRSWMDFHHIFRGHCLSVFTRLGFYAESFVSNHISSKNINANIVYIK